MNSKYYSLEKLNKNINIEFQKFNIYFQVINDLDLMDRVKFVKDNFKANDYAHNKNFLEVLTYFVDIQNKDKFIDIMIEFIQNIYKILDA